jgi:hypothetical protein
MYGENFSGDGFTNVAGEVASLTLEFFANRRENFRKE